jgi:hypothetical protein
MPLILIAKISSYQQEQARIPALFSNFARYNSKTGIVV